MRPRSVGASQQEPLADGDAQAHQGAALLLRLDPLGDQLAAGLGGEVDHARHQRLAGRVAVNVAHQLHVQLDDLRPQLRDVPQRGEARPGVVDRDPRVGEVAPQQAARRAVVLDGHALGDLHHQRPLRIDGQGSQLAQLGEHRRRQVDGEPRAVG